MCLFGSEEGVWQPKRVYTFTSLVVNFEDIPLPYLRNSKNGKRTLYLILD